jgi:hypothetical protein
MSDEACVRLRPGRFMAWVEAGSVPTDLACRRWSFPSRVGGRMLWFVAETKRLLLASRAAAMRSWVTGSSRSVAASNRSERHVPGWGCVFGWQPHGYVGEITERYSTPSRVGQSHGQGRYRGATVSRNGQIPVGAVAVGGMPQARVREPWPPLRAIRIQKHSGPSLFRSAGAAERRYASPSSAIFEAHWPDQRTSGRSAR